MDKRLKMEFLYATKTFEDIIMCDAGLYCRGKIKNADELAKEIKDLKNIKPKDITPGHVEIAKKGLQRNKQIYRTVYNRLDYFSRTHS